LTVLNLIKLRISIFGTIAFIIGISTLAFTAILTYSGAFNIYAILLMVIAFNLLQWIFAPKLIDSMYKARELSVRDNPKLHQMVDNICRKSGMKKPKLMLANIPIPNAFAYGSPRYGNRVAVTTGLLDNLEKEEVEAVIAHEVGHLKHRDVQVMMFASVLPAIFYWIGFTFMWSSMFSGGRRDSGGTVLIGIGAMLIYWMLSLLVLSLSRVREYYADRHAVNTVDDGARKLSKALAKIATTETKTLSRGKSKRTSNFKTLFINDPDTAKTDSEAISIFQKKSSDRGLVDKILSKKVTGFDHFMEVFSTHPNMVKRLRALQNI